MSLKDIVESQHMAFFEHNKWLSLNLYDVVTVAL